MSQSTSEHRNRAPRSLNFAMITISTSRYNALKAGRQASNPSGAVAKKGIEEAGYQIIYTDLVPDDQTLIQKSVKQATNTPAVDVIVMFGGTGVTKQDITIETVAPLFEKDLPGFGEIFRRLSFEIVGSAAIITRATAGLIQGKVVFCLPGSPQAVELALTRLILPEAAHIVEHATE